MFRCLLLPVLAVALCAPSLQAAKGKPNVLFILADDQRWDTIGALGNPEVKTPVLDQLVQRGFHFNNAYCQGSMIGAVCLPSRTMILTGRSLWHLPKDLQSLEPPAGVPLLPSLINAAGYATFHSGKPDNACRYANAQFQTNIESGKNRNSAVEHTENVLRFLSAHQGDKPFFIFVAPPVPHDPRWASKPFVDLYDPDKLTLSKNYMPQHPFDNGELHIRDEELAHFPRTPEQMRKHLADYYASVSELDHEVGRIFAAIHDRGWDENTVVVFSSDQGLAVGGRHGLMGKQNLYEHVKPPLIIAGPGIPHGQSDALVYLYDLFPTFCELTGAAIPPGTEGQSLLPIVHGRQQSLRPWLMGAYRECQRMIRDKRWKLLAYHVNGTHTYQLFDLANDPDEIHDLSADPKYAAERERLEKLLQDARRHFDDPIDFNATGAQAAR